jgi:hypothetical protein
VIESAPRIVPAKADVGIDNGLMPIQPGAESIEHFLAADAAALAPGNGASHRHHPWPMIPSIPCAYSTKFQLIGV